MFCPEEEIPPFKEDTQPGTIDHEDLKKADPEYWNKFQRHLTYTCPVGYVIGRPNGDYSEQQDPMPEELEIRKYIFSPNGFYINCCVYVNMEVWNASRF